MARGSLNSLSLDSLIDKEYICMEINFDLTTYILHIIIICASLPIVWFNKLFTKEAKKLHSISNYDKILSFIILLMVVNLGLDG